LQRTKIEQLIVSAVRTAGTRQGPRDVQRLQQFAALALAARRETRKARRRLTVLAANSAILQRQAAVVGAATACVLWVALGDPSDYPCGAAYRKAMGLNLKERSSGRYQGQLKITKRGPSIVRRWLYFAAMRRVQAAPVRAWYEAKKARDKDQGKGALMAVMRKLALALHAVGARGEPFEAWRLFPGKSIARKALEGQTPTTSASS
jgi:transposase